MRTRTRFPFCIAVAVCGAGTALVSNNANATVLDFYSGITFGGGSITLSNSVDSYTGFYNGGLDGAVPNPDTGPNYGVVFTNDALASLNSHTPSGGELGFASGLSGYNHLMNVAAGFTTGLAFYYSFEQPYFSVPYTPEINIYDGLNGQGNLLASITLSIQGHDGCSTLYCNFTEIGVTFSGTAESVSFAGPGAYAAYSGITLGSASVNATPLPAALPLFATGLGALGLLGWRRKRKKSAAIASA